MIEDSEAECPTSVARAQQIRSQLDHLIAKMHQKGMTPLFIFTVQSFQCNQHEGVGNQHTDSTSRTHTQLTPHGLASVIKAMELELARLKARTS